MINNVYDKQKHLNSKTTLRLTNCPRCDGPSFRSAGIIRLTVTSTEHESSWIPAPYKTTIIIKDHNIKRSFRAWNRVSMAIPRNSLHKLRASCAMIEDVTPLENRPEHRPSAMSIRENGSVRHTSVLSNKICLQIIHSTEVIFLLAEAGYYIALHREPPWLNDRLASRLVGWLAGSLTNGLTSDYTFLQHVILISKTCLQDDYSLNSHMYRYAYTSLHSLMNFMIRSSSRNLSSSAFHIMEPNIRGSYRVVL
jgi:hypothetical protein